MSLNKVILIGNAGKDPDVRYFDNGNVVANFPLATSERGYKLANGTEVPERTEWHNIVATRDRAQFVEKYVKKGSLMYIEGKIRTRNFDDRDGNKRYITEIYADRIEFYSTGSGNRRGEDQQEAGHANGTTANIGTAAAEIPSASEPTDDLPF
jgi:single-strand DNA-binding protein